MAARGAISMSLELRICKECNEEKIIDDYYSFKLRGIKYNRWTCKPCYNENMKQYRKNNPDKCKDWDLKQLYGITNADRLQMVKDQLGRCAICKNDTKLVVDHSHVNKQVRGLLCNSCNMALGLFGDSDTIVEAALNYLRGTCTNAASKSCKI